MPKAQETTTIAIPPQSARRTVTKFAAPDSLSENMGAYTVKDGELDGFIGTENIPELLKAFGIADRSAGEFPFQHIIRRDGDFHAMRIEPESTHSVDGAIVKAHRWSYSCKPKDQY